MQIKQGINQPDALQKFTNEIRQLAHEHPYCKIMLSATLQCHDRDVKHIEYETRIIKKLQTIGRATD